MKNLTKLNINPEKVIQNEELIVLRGGYDDCGGGFTRYFCTVWYCMECDPTFGPACVPEGTVDVNSYVAEKAGAWNADCI